ncbi:DUF1737 domain-containing protein, partial [Escherichia coli]|nr:DUF1737 domain-containing protein [Escherichia coli]
MSDFWDLISAPSSGALRGRVSEKMKAGWIPSGSPFPHGGALLQ